MAKHRRTLATERSQPNRRTSQSSCPRPQRRCRVAHGKEDHLTARELSQQAHEHSMNALKLAEELTKEHGKVQQIIDGWRNQIMAQVKILIRPNGPYRVEAPERR